MPMHMRHVGYEAGTSGKRQQLTVRAWQRVLHKKELMDTSRQHTNHTPATSEWRGIGGVRTGAERKKSLAVCCQWPSELTHQGVRRFSWTGLAQAQRNANDGISLAQTAEGSLGQINDNVQRIRELTVQALNDTNSSDDLQSIQNEIGERLAEITRISEQTDFNGVAVLGGADGEAVNVNIQVGAKDGQTITIAYDAINLESLTLEGFSVAGAPAATAADVIAFAEDADTVTVDGVTYTKAGDTWTGDDGDDTDPDPANHVAATELSSTQLASLIAEQDTDVTFGDYTIAADGAVTTDVAGEATAVYVENDALTATPEAEATANPLATLDNALKQIDDLRSELGAIQNRFEDAVTNLRTNETNLSAARSRIEDADYAVEVANMTRAQILQQAGTSVLAQANQIPQNVLSLLG